MKRFNPTIDERFIGNEKNFEDTLINYYCESYHIVEDPESENSSYVYVDVEKGRYVFRLDNKYIERIQDVYDIDVVLEN